jgi:hypothetical protein
MISRRLVAYSTLTLIAMPSAGRPASIPAQPSSHSQGMAADCSDLHTTFDGQPAIVRSEEKSLPVSQTPKLNVHSAPNDGVQIQGWDKDSYSITACKMAEGPESRAEGIFSQIHVSIANGEVSASGPSEASHWSVFFLIHAPKGGNISLEATNGPLSIYDLDGTLRARATNGPISIKNLTGNADLEATNGPISVSGSSGNMRLRTQNGPISVNVDDSTWKGKGLTADAQNGPVTLHVPSGFQSSFLVESRGHGPVSCSSSICGDARKTWDDDRRRIEFGSSPALIHLSTDNGPVSVR